MKATQPAMAGSDQHVAPRSKHRILVVDDSRDSADSLAMMLRIMGNLVHTAHDGVEAVNVAATFKPDVVLLDIGLPLLNGFDAARRMRSQSGGNDMVIVALTGWGQEEDRRRSQEAGFDHHIVKPVDPVALEKLLDALETTTTGTRLAHRSPPVTIRDTSQRIKDDSKQQKY
jgi:DNA-binding response OmpR family regulator